MAVPHLSTNFQDILDPRFQRILSEQFQDLPDMLPSLFTFAPDNGRDSMLLGDLELLLDHGRMKHVGDGFGSAADRHAHTRSEGHLQRAIAVMNCSRS